MWHYVIAYTHLLDASSLNIQNNISEGFIEVLDIDIRRQGRNILNTISQYLSYMLSGYKYNEATFSLLSSYLSSFWNISVPTPLIMSHFIDVKPSWNIFRNVIHSRQAAWYLYKFSFEAIDENFCDEKLHIVSSIMRISSIRI